ncbi:hypothetical protein [Deinococcus pimensis]|uniref:hypothetical protein n=1 Tax=Deinococcus pimensis TaxID=309888 RepID=UPI0004B0D53A|nr:hypothetical protein [Deinococcus pimensis]
MRHVLYVELRGEDAARRLRPLLDDLARVPGFRGGELLRSPAQPGLALVQARFDVEPPDVSLPGGARAWTFVVEHAHEAPHDPLE